MSAPKHSPYRTLIEALEQIADGGDMWSAGIAAVGLEAAKEHRADYNELRDVLILAATAAQSGWLTPGSITLRYVLAEANAALSAADATYEETS